MKHWKKLAGYNQFQVVLRKLVGISVWYPKLGLRLKLRLFIKQISFFKIMFDVIVLVIWGREVSRNVILNCWAQEKAYHRESTEP
jgi:hypothetical protein